MCSEKKAIRGTREWAVAEIDCCTGCPHDCLYCYARYAAVTKEQLSVEQWRRCAIREDDVTRLHPLYPGQVMFPTSHDIVPENLAACSQVIRNLLDSGNRVLVVSKPHLECITELCARFGAEDDRRNILFRFTITARKREILNFWEPGAPGYAERKESLQYAFNNGFQTSVSVEPILDMADVVALVNELLPYISHSIWLGKMNKIDRRVRAVSCRKENEIRRIVQEQTADHIFALYSQLHKIERVRWKDSIKAVVGLPGAEEPGQDI